MSEITFKEIRASIKELTEYQQETARQMRETDRKLEETDRLIKETTQQMKETDRKLDRKLEETDRLIKETDRLIKENARQMKETDKRINKLETLFTGQWGKLMESLVAGDLVKLLNERKIKVETTYENIKSKWQDKDYEFDIIARNGEEIVVTEVKTTMHAEDVNHFLNHLRRYREMTPDMENKKIYGAMAYLCTKKDVIIYAQKQGLFVIRATGSSASILNEKTFQPTNF